MGKVVEFKTRIAAGPYASVDRSASAQIVIFPGVRMERHDLDLGYRVRKSAGTDEFRGLGRNPKVRQTS